MYLQAWDLKEKGEKARYIIQNTQAYSLKCKLYIMMHSLNYAPI